MSYSLDKRACDKAELHRKKCYATQNFASSCGCAWIKRAYKASLLCSFSAPWKFYLRMQASIRGLISNPLFIILRVFRKKAYSFYQLSSYTSLAMLCYILVFPRTNPHVHEQKQAAALSLLVPVVFLKCTCAGPFLSLR